MAITLLLLVLLRCISSQTRGVSDDLSANLVNFPSEEELTRTHKHAVKLGITTVDVMGGRGKVAVEVYANEGGLPRQFCQMGPDCKDAYLYLPVAPIPDGTFESLVADFAEVRKAGKEMHPDTDRCRSQRLHDWRRDAAKAYKMLTDVWILLYRGSAPSELSKEIRSTQDEFDKLIRTIEAAQRNGITDGDMEELSGRISQSAANFVRVIDATVRKLKDQIRACEAGTAVRPGKPSGNAEEAARLRQKLEGVTQHLAAAKEETVRERAVTTKEKAIAERVRAENDRLRSENRAQMARIGELTAPFKILTDAFIALERFPNALFSRYAMILAFKAGPNYASGFLPAIRNCVTQHPRQETADDFPPFLRCMEAQRTRHKHRPYIARFARQCEPLILYPVFGKYVQYIFKHKDHILIQWQGKSATQLSYIVQFVTLIECDQFRDSVQILLCLVCRWSTFPSFQFFIGAANHAAVDVADVSIRVKEYLEERQLVTSFVQKWKDMCDRFFTKPSDYKLPSRQHI